MIPEAILPQQQSPPVTTEDPMKARLNNTIPSSLPSDVSIQNRMLLVSYFLIIPV